MPGYKKIMIALGDQELSPQAVSAVQNEIKNNPGAEFILVGTEHQIPATFFQIPSMTEVAKREHAEGVAKLDKAGQSLNVPPENRLLKTCSSDSELKRIARQEGADGMMSVEETSNNKPSVVSLRPTR